MPDYLVRFLQVHETFRMPELEALAIIENVSLAIKDYRGDVPFCLISVPSDADASRLIRRSILTQSIYSHWATAPTIPTLLTSILSHPSISLPSMQTPSFKFSIDAFQGTRNRHQQREIITTFLSALPFTGPITMTSPTNHYTILEEWTANSFALGITTPTKVHFGRLLASGARDLARTYDLKKRQWISTTSMDAELALISANIALAAPGKLFYDPFCGTGSFPIAVGHFGALAFGSDIDGRPLRGKNGKSVRGNFKQYRIESSFGDVFSADLTNSPLRINNPSVRLFDGIVCDMPYGVREGLKVLGLKDATKTPWLIEAGKAQGNDAKYVPPTKPYSFFDMLADILAFGTTTLSPGGRLAFWMPAVDESSTEYPIPSHPALRRVAVCTQQFNKWSRWLITYQRLRDEEVDEAEVMEWEKEREAARKSGTTADELNPFRKSYFEGFQE